MHITLKSLPKLSALLVLSTLFAQAGPASAQGLLAPESGTGWHQHGVATAGRYMVAAANPLAAEAGRDMLRRGGSAVDAAIAIQLVLGLVEPQSSGLGGGALLLHYDAATGRVSSYDGREKAPSSAHPDRFLINGKPIPFRQAVKSTLSIGVPGTVRLIEYAHQRHGRLPWKDVFAPALRLATQGFAVSPRLAGLLAGTDPRTLSPAARAYFYDPHWRPWPIGYRLVNPEYAETLRTIAANGSAGFYGGDIAAGIVRASAVEPSATGSISADDLARYSVIEREPICTPYRKHKVCVMGPPSSAGHTIGQALALLEPYDLGTDARSAMAPRATHLMAEALKLAFADRNRYLADPDYVRPPEGLLDPAYIASRRRQISLERPLDKVAPGIPPGLDKRARGEDATIEAAGTSHIAVIDADGNAVSMTTTIESAFGSGQWTHGFLLNNELTDFSFLPADREGRPIANRIEGDKRPRSSMAPTIVFDEQGKPAMVVGSAGGSLIIPYVLKALIAVIDWKLDAARALALPNLAAPTRDVLLEYPPTTGPSALGSPAGPFGVLTTALGLKSFGQSLRLDSMTSGTQLIIRRPGGGLEGAADPRREGAALGD
ncbi:MAG: gamma-glutamyltransferase [Proteobacteria bacterium]|nr:gamma-glutamyltransferase [Pseudomonadota bacterium]